MCLLCIYMSIEEHFFTRSLLSLLLLLSCMAMKLSSTTNEVFAMHTISNAMRPIYTICDDVSLLTARGIGWDECSTYACSNVIITAHSHAAASSPLCSGMYRIEGCDTEEEIQRLFDDLNLKMKTPSMVCAPPSVASIIKKYHQQHTHDILSWTKAGTIQCTRVDVQQTLANITPLLLNKTQCSTTMTPYVINGPIPCKIAAKLLRLGVEPTQLDIGAVALLQHDIESVTFPTRVIWIAVFCEEHQLPCGWGAVLGLHTGRPVFVTLCDNDNISKQQHHDAKISLFASCITFCLNSGCCEFLHVHSKDDDAKEDQWYHQHSNNTLLVIPPEEVLSVVSTCTLEILHHARVTTTNAAAVEFAATRTCVKTPFDARNIHAGFSAWINGTHIRGTHVGDGRMFDQDENTYLWDFGTCSYLGIEHHTDLVNAAQHAYTKHGLSTVAAPVYLHNPMLDETETIVGEALRGHFLLTPKTHIGTNVLVTSSVHSEQDVIILDKFAHASIHFATDVAKARGAPKILVPNEDLDTVRDVISAFASVGKRRIWYMTDGLHSMNGTLTPPEFIEKILAMSPHVWVFIDDSHGTGWTGPNGCGAWLEAYGTRPRDRVVVAISLCKAVAAGGGGLLYPSKEERDYARLAAIAYNWTAPLNAPILAAIQKFFTWIRTEEGKQRQDKLKCVIRTFVNGMRELAPHVHLNNHEILPIKSIHVGQSGDALNVIQKLREDGFYVCVESYPVVAKGHAAIRITFNANIPEHVCIDLCKSLAQHCVTFPDFSVRVEDPVFKRTGETQRRQPVNVRSLLCMQTKAPQKTVTTEDKIKCKNEENITSGGIHVEPLTTQKQVDQLLQWYSIDDPLSVCLGLTKEDWIPLLKMLLYPCIGNGISFVAMHGNEVVGGLVVDKGQGVSPTNNDIPERMRPVLSLLSEVSAPAEKMCAQSKIPVFTVLIATTKPSCRNRNIALKLATRLWTYDASVFIVAPTSSDYSRRICARLGMKEVNKLDYSTWMYEGKAVFANAPKPHTCSTLQALEYHPTWWCKASTVSSILVRQCVSMYTVFIFMCLVLIFVLLVLGVWRKNTTTTTTTTTY